MKKSEQSYTGYYFLIAVVIFYVIVFFINPGKISESLNFTTNIFKQIIPIFILVFGLTIAINYFVTPQRISKYIGEKAGIKKWIIAVVGGIISTGPIYMWYPMLKELRNKGVKNGFIATFLYNRAIKLPLIPMIVYYFGIEFTVVLTIVMIISSIIQGLIIERSVKI